MTDQVSELLEEQQNVHKFLFHEGQTNPLCLQHLQLYLKQFSLLCLLLKLLHQDLEDMAKPVKIKGSESCPPAVQGSLVLYPSELDLSSPMFNLWVATCERIKQGHTRCTSGGFPARLAEVPAEPPLGKVAKLYGVVLNYKRCR